MRKKTLDEVELIDDFLFSEVMKDNETARLMLERLMGMSITKLEYVSTQESIKSNPEYKGSRYDLYVTDSNDVVYDVEVQTAMSSDMGKRMRYYQSLIDYKRIHSGARSFRELPKSVIIFICDFDPFSEGLCRYTFRYTCAEKPHIVSSDDAQRIIFNVRGTEVNVAPEVKLFLDYVRNSSVGKDIEDDSLISRLNEQIAMVKQDPERRREFMSLEEKMYERELLGRKEGLEEGRNEGRAEERRRMIELLRKKGMSEADIKELLAG